MARSQGIEPRSQAPEAYVISIGPRAHHRSNNDSKVKYRGTSIKNQEDENTIVLKKGLRHTWPRSNMV
jgi:hypothetical protein